jgi:hypothetical protein
MNIESTVCIICFNLLYLPIDIVDVVVIRISRFADTPASCSGSGNSISFDLQALLSFCHWKIHLMYQRNDVVQTYIKKIYTEDVK